MQQDKIQAGMTTEPTISRLLKTGEARVLVDMRTVEKTKAALGGTYPAASLYMPTDWVEKTQADRAEARQRLRQDAASTSIPTAPPKSPRKMPKDFYVGDKEGYIKALADGKGMFTSDGVMPEGGPETVLAVLSAFSKNAEGQERRSVEDLHDRVREEREVTVRSSRRPLSRSDAVVASRDSGRRRSS